MRHAERPSPAARRFGLPLVFLLLLVSTSLAAERPRVAVVIDDLGNQWLSGINAIAIPFIQTVAIMPGRPFTERLAEASHQAAKTVIVHAPMSNESDFPLGPLGLDRREGRDQMLLNLWQGLDSVPYAEGLSNHMGSRLTRDSEAMGWVMTELKSRNLFFFDSLTVADSQGWRMADAMGVPWHRRQVFLDNVPTQEYLARQWKAALSIAERTGSVTIICHPYPETLAFFASLDPKDYLQFDWVSLKELLYRPETRLVPDWRPHNMPRGAVLPARG